MQWVLVHEMKQHEMGRVWKRLLAFSTSALNLLALMGMPRDSFSSGPWFVSTDQQNGQEFPQQISASGHSCLRLRGWRSQSAEDLVASTEA